MSSRSSDGSLRNDKRNKMRKTQRREGEIIVCPKCGSIMAATQTQQGSVFVCGSCRAEVRILQDGTLEE